MSLAIRSKFCFVTTVALLLSSLNVLGQEPVDSLEANTILLSDSTVFAQTYPLDSLTYAKHSPAKATIMSAVLPGLGQVYNKKYWKVPVVYAAIGISVSYYLKFQNKYQQYRRAYIDYNDRDDNTNYWKTMNFPPNIDLPNTLTRNKDQYRTWRDWAIVAVGLSYALNIIDANVDAHLMDFSLDDNISLNIQPCFLEKDIDSKKIGLSLQLTF